MGGSRFASPKQLPTIKYTALNIKMKALVLILCFAVAATVATPIGGGAGQDDCSDCVNHCKKVKKVKYVEEYDQTCHNEHKEKSTYKEVCTDDRKKVCEKFWQEDGYGGKIWTEDPSKCHWLQESECTQEPRPVKDCKDYIDEVCEPIHKNVPKQHECEVCGGKEKSCRQLDTKYYGH